jgi:lon-related putative ATP-dependent protease
MSPAKRRAQQSPHHLKPGQLRWRCDPSIFSFKTTEEIGDCPINIIGQNRAQEALQLGLSVRSEGYNMFVTGDVGSGRSTVVRRMLARVERGETPPDDVVYVNNFEATDQPRKLIFPAGKGCAFFRAMNELIESLSKDLPKLFDSELYRKRRTQVIEAAGQEQKARLKSFEAMVQEQGFALVQVQMGPLIRPQLVPVVAGNPVEMDQLEQLVEQGQFRREDYEEFAKKRSKLAGELEALGKEMRNLEREVRRQLAELDRTLARPLVEESVGEVRSAFRAEGLEHYLDQVTQDILDHLGEFRLPEDAASQEGAAEASQGPPAQEPTRYAVNVVVDNSNTKGRPIIWETAPSYRNLFGTIEKARASSGEWETDHTRIKAGSLLRANGGFLVLDAMDVLVEPGVWMALKRTLRTRKVEIQFFDPLQLLSAISLKPEPIPIDVKVLMIGTRHIYRLLYALDEDFQKIFKVKAEFAMHTPLSAEELQNYACFVHKKAQDDALLPFHRSAVATVVEHGVRLSGNHDRLTTRFNQIADLVREAGYWARRNGAKHVKADHVGRALEHKVYRVNLIEEMLRERIAEGTVLLDLAGEKIGQVNGLAVLDAGDHLFGQPSRITATTAMGRAGIIDLDREAEMSGSIHTKGVLILSGFLRARFAQDKPLTLTASLCFEQNYGGVEGDSASSAELYALLSSLAEVPIRQGIAVTGSVNQKGEIQPIGGVNEKVEGFFDLCRLKELSGEQGVMIPTRNIPQLMLRRDLVAAVRKGEFHVWAVSTIEEGLEVLTGIPAGARAADGSYDEGSVFARADAKLCRLAEQVGRFGPADLGAAP